MRQKCWNEFVNTMVKNCKYMDWQEYTQDETPIFHYVSDKIGEWRIGLMSRNDHATILIDKQLLWRRYENRLACSNMYEVFDYMQKNNCHALHLEWQDAYVAG